MNYHAQIAQDFAKRIAALGFRVFIAKGGEGDYGFVTDDTGARVMSFQCRYGSELSGNYGPPSRESGTGWGLEQNQSDLRTSEDVRKALYEMPPLWCGKGWKSFTTLDQHLKMYGSSSNYVEFAQSVEGANS